MSQHGVKRTMPYVRLGNSGLKVSRIILGMMTYGDRRWFVTPWALSEEEGIQHVKAAFEAGINTFDTANIYANGRSEEILGKAIKVLNLPRDEIVIMTKVSGPVADTFEASFKPGQDPNTLGFVNQCGLSRKHIFDSVKHSLRRLGLDHIDVLQCHRFDPTTPIEETMHALNDVVKAGLVRYIGMSSCYAYQFSQMQNYAITHGLTPFISMQNHYNLIYREEEREMMPTLKHFGVGSIPWSPLARGMVTRPWSATSNRKESDIGIRMFYTKESEGIVNRVEELAKKHNVSMAQIGVAWLLSKDVVSAPVVGATSLEKLADLVAAVHLTLTEEEIKDLEAPYKAQAITGH